MVQSIKIPISALDDFAPWQALATKPLCAVFGVDPYLLGMRRYRGLGPLALPDEWTKGHVVAYRVADLRRWLGDLRSDVEQYATTLGDVLSKYEADDPALVRLFARVQAEKQSPLGFQFTPAGRSAYLQSICSF